MILKAGKPDSKVKVSYSPIFIITVKNDKFLYLDDTSDEYKCVSTSLKTMLPVLFKSTAFTQSVTALSEVWLTNTLQSQSDTSSLPYEKF